MAAIQVIRTAIKEKKEIRDKYLATLRGLNNQVRDKQAEIDRLDSEIINLQEALTTLKPGEQNDID